MTFRGARSVCGFYGAVILLGGWPKVRILE